MLILILHIQAKIWKQLLYQTTKFNTEGEIRKVGQDLLFVLGLKTLIFSGLKKNKNWEVCCCIILNNNFWFSCKNVKFLSYFVWELSKLMKSELNDFSVKFLVSDS